MPTPQEGLDITTMIDGRPTPLHVQPSTGNEVLLQAGVRMAADRFSTGRALVEEDSPSAVVCHCDGTAGAIFRCLAENMAIRSDLCANERIIASGLGPKAGRLLQAREACANCVLNFIGSK
jgi:hypothetical protein